VEEPAANPLLGFVRSECRMFNSAQRPIVLTLAPLQPQQHSFSAIRQGRAPSAGLTQVLYKCGDDLRNDQIVMQIQKKMEQLLHADPDLGPDIPIQFVTYKVS
jgi:hypothetical protein